MMAAPIVISLAEKLVAVPDYWNPRIIAGYNGNEVRIARVRGDFTWHAHADSDEMFLVISGELGIEFRDGIRRLKAGEMIVVPRGTEHRPFADEDCEIMMLDREGEPNTGVNPSAMTRATLEVI